MAKCWMDTGKGEPCAPSLEPFTVVATGEVVELCDFCARWHRTLGKAREERRWEAAGWRRI